MFFETIKKLFTVPATIDQQQIGRQPANPDPCDEPEDDAIFCSFCDAWATDVDTASEAGWIPSFFDADGVECSDIVCHTCIARTMRLDDETGEFVLIPESAAVGR